MVCPNCKSQLSNQAKFCAECGTNISVAEGKEISSPPPMVSKAAENRNRNIMGQIIKSMAIIIAVLGVVIAFVLAVLNMNIVITPENKINFDIALKLKKFDGDIFIFALLADLILGFIIYGIGAVIDLICGRKR